MDKNEVLRTMKLMLSDIVGLDIVGEDVKDMIYAHEYGADSMQLLSFLLKVEEEFSFKIDEEDLDIQLINDLNLFSTYVSTHGQT